MQKFIVKNAKTVEILQKDMFLPFDRAEIEIHSQDAQRTIYVDKLPIACNEDGSPRYFEYDRDRSELYVELYVVFIDKYGSNGFGFGIVETPKGLVPICTDLKENIHDKLLKRLGWTCLDYESRKNIAEASMHLILYVSHVCHHTSIYRKIKKKYEKRNHAVDITNPEPKRQFLSGNVYIEWANDRDEQLVHKYTRRTEGWDVRGHYRHYKSGKVVFVKPHHKGKPGCTTVKEFETKGDMMVHIEREITKEQYEQAQKEGASVLIDDSVKCGYGLYGCDVIEKDGKYILRYDRGNSCD